MRLTINKKRLINISIVLYLAAPPSTVTSEVETAGGRAANAYRQQPFPAAPNDLTRIYYLDTANKLAPLPFEIGITSLNVHSVARENKRSEVKLNGLKATAVLNGSNPSFYVFVADRMDPPPHLLVRLMSKQASRRFTVTVIKGRKGYMPLHEENVRLDYRILERLSVEAGEGRIRFVNYMEIRPRQSLEPGEYAIIGDSLAAIATFSIQ